MLSREADIITTVNFTDFCLAKQAEAYARMHREEAEKYMAAAANIERGYTADEDFAPYSCML